MFAKSSVLQLSCCLNVTCNGLVDQHQSAAAGQSMHACKYAAANVVATAAAAAAAHLMAPVRASVTDPDLPDGTTAPALHVTCTT
jgi:hypothetical protein